MNLSDVRLKLVRVSEIRGHAYNVDVNSQFEARFKSKITTENIPTELGEDIEVELSLEASMPKTPEPFFMMSVIGTFEIMRKGVIDGLSPQESSYHLGSLIFPYLRNLAKPVIEHLSAADIDFPFSMPPPPTNGAQATKQARGKKLK